MTATSFRWNAASQSRSSLIRICWSDWARWDWPPEAESAGTRKARNSSVGRVMGPSRKSCGRLQRSLNDRLRAAVRTEHLGMQLLAEIDLRFGVVAGIPFVLHDFEPQVVQR